MKLTDIDLNDKSEVAAAHALLAAILGPAVSDDIPSAPSLNQTTASLSQDPATVFGGQSAAPLPGTPAPSTAGAGPSSTAPSTAGAGPSSTAPAGLPAISAGLPGLPGLAQPPASSVPAAVAPTPPAPGVELDSEGLPWDARIHASTKSKTSKGVWVAKRGVNDDAFVAQVEAELRVGVSAQSAAPLAFGAAQPAVTPTTTVDAPTTFEELMPRITSATVAGTLPAVALQQACVALGLPNVVALQTSPVYVPHVWAHLRATYPALA